jgi:hypothetical protein
VLNSLDRRNCILRVVGWVLVRGVRSDHRRQYCFRSGGKRHAETVSRVVQLDII